MTDAKKRLSLDLEDEFYTVFRSTGYVTSGQASELAEAAQAILSKRLEDLLADHPSEDVKLDAEFSNCLSQLLNPGKR